jgi:hypothetical protein
MRNLQDARSTWEDGDLRISKRVNSVLDFFSIEPTKAIEHEITKAIS